MSPAEKKHVLVLCPSTWDHEMLARPDIAEKYRVSFWAQELYDVPPVWRALTFDVFRYIREGVAAWKGRGLDGIVGTGDYPGCLLAASMAQDLGLTSPKPREVVLFSHKYYSRQIQQRIVPQATPGFTAIDPFGNPSSNGLTYPLFVKPVKGTMSIRARSVKTRDELPEAVRVTLRERFRAHLLLRPFQQFLREYSDRKIPAHYFIAEEMLAGRQVTVDGFVEKGRAVIMGVVDSVMFPGTMSFKRFDHPSTLPEEVQARMSAIARDLIEGSGFDASCFNIEMFWDEERDSIHIIEVNPRMSYQFGDLYEKVDGTNTYAIQLRLATGEPAGWIPRQGAHGAAASFVLRRFSDAEVVAVPSEQRIREVIERFPGTVVKVLCKAGERLSDHDQDVGSYRYGIVNMGAATRDELFANWEIAERLLAFTFR